MFRLARVSGFGQFNSADGYVFRPTNIQEIRELFDLAKDTGRKIVLRGSGNSYGDAAIGNERLILDLTRMRRILSWDAKTGQIECEPGVTIEGLWRYTIEDGYWPPIVSGTMYPTLGGALAMNIHGKNNYAVGPIGDHVLEIDVLTSSGTVRTFTPDDEEFFAVISGFGMLGVLVRIKLQMKRVESGDLKVLSLSCRNWEEQFELFERFEHDADYMVTWIDAFGKGPAAGRGQFHAGWYVHDDPAKSRNLRPEHQELPDTVLGLVPKSIVWRALKLFCNRPGMRFMNRARHEASRVLGHGKTIVQSLVGFSFLLDYVPNWRKAYMPGGFIQYQSFVPKEHARRVFARQIELQQEFRMESFLCVMKRHRPDRFLFSHSVDGYSLALDFKVSDSQWPRMQELAQRMNELVLEAGGRFYFAKDSTLRPEDARRYLGAKTLEKYRQFRAELDPENLFTSGLAERLELV
jgi:decaprenylphospho-beta-D-ribofuranose 2-oxidase